MKQLTLIATLALVMMSSQAFALDADLVIEKFSLALSRDRKAVENEVRKGKNANVVTQNILNAYINNKHTIRVDLQTAGIASTKEIDARLVVYLNNDHGGIILDANQILYPFGRLSAKTTTQYLRGEPLRTTKMYVPMDIYLPSAMRERLVALVAAINSGNFGELHSRRN